jgi:hypothetical protein
LNINYYKESCIPAEMEKFGWLATDEGNNQHLPIDNGLLGIDDHIFPDVRTGIYQ